MNVLAFVHFDNPDVLRYQSVPDRSSNLAANVLLQGLTAPYLVHDSHSLQADQTMLVHAAAGGVGRSRVSVKWPKYG